MIVDASHTCKSTQPLAGVCSCTQSEGDLFNPVSEVSLDMAGRSAHLHSLISRLHQLTCFPHSEMCGSSDHTFPGGPCRYLHGSCASSRRAPPTAPAPCSDMLTRPRKNEEPSNPEAAERPVCQRRGHKPHGSLGCCHLAKVSRDAEV